MAPSQPAVANLLAPGVGLPTPRLPTHHHRTTRVLMATVGQRIGGNRANQGKYNKGMVGMPTMSGTTLTHSLGNLVT